MGTRKRGNKWWIDFSFKGQRFRFTSPENSINGAKAYEAVLRQRLAKGDDILKPTISSPLFSDFVNKWLTTYVKSNNKHSEFKTKQSLFNAYLLPFFGKLKLDQITTYKIEEFKSVKLKTNLKPKTINNLLSALRSSLNIAQEWNLLITAPKIKLLKVPPQKFDYLSFEESEYLLEHTTDIWHDMFLLAVRTGLRFGEIIALTWSDIDFANNQITINHSITRGMIGSPKSNKIRYVPLINSVKNMLLNRLKNKSKNDQYVFSLNDDKPMKQIYCIKNLSRICKQLKMRKITWHVFRHTFASHLANREKPIQVIQNLLGHSDIKTTMRYAHLSPITLRDSIEVLDLKY